MRSVVVRAVFWCALALLLTLSVSQASAADITVRILALDEPGFPPGRPLTAVVTDAQVDVAVFRAVNRADLADPARRQLVPGFPQRLALNPATATATFNIPAGEQEVQVELTSAPGTTELKPATLTGLANVTQSVTVVMPKEDRCIDCPPCCPSPPCCEMTHSKRGHRLFGHR